MSYEWKSLRDLDEHKSECRIKQAKHLSDNLYERMRAHIVRVAREFPEDIVFVAEKLGCSVSTVRKYLKFVPWEHLMCDPSLADQFDWRSMDWRRWERLLLRHPQFVSRLPEKNPLRMNSIVRIVKVHPETAIFFDLKQLNECPGFFAELLKQRPEFDVLCTDWSIFEWHDLGELLQYQPKYFDRTPKIDTLLPFFWYEIVRRNQWLYGYSFILERMNERPHSEWPFNFKVYYLRIHPEFESEFHEWGKIDWADLEDIQRDQPELYARHYDKPPQAYKKHGNEMEQKS